MGAVSADDYRTGTRAGARGGVTTLIDFAIPYAGESLAQAADNWMKKAQGKALIDYTFHICITRWNDHKDQIKGMVDRGFTTFKEFMIYESEGWQSDDRAMFGTLEFTPLLSVDLAYLHKVVAVNMLGALVMTRACVPYMRSGAAIVNQSSTAAWMHYDYYSFTKLAVNGITCVLARELGPRGIRVNAIAPGPTDTEALRAQVPQDYIKSMVAQMPLARLGTPQDLLKALVFLLSEDAAWVTGLVMNVDGGQWMRA